MIKHTHVINIKMSELLTFTAWESIVSLSTLSTFLTNHVVSTLTLPSKVGALEAERAVRVAATGYAAIVEVCGQCVHTWLTELRVIPVTTHKTLTAHVMMQSTAHVMIQFTHENLVISLNWIPIPKNFTFNPYTCYQFPSDKNVLNTCSIPEMYQYKDIHVGMIEVLL